MICEICGAMEHLFKHPWKPIQVCYDCKREALQEDEAKFKGVK